MNINYEDIIEKAAQRAEKLKELQQYAEGAEDRAHEMLNAMLYFDHLANRVKALDAEGKELLGPVSMRAQHIGDWARSGYRALTDQGAKHLQILDLVKDLK